MLVPIAVAGGGAGTVGGSDKEIGVEGKVQIRCACRIDTEEPGWGDADGPEGSIVYEDLVAECGGGISEAAFCECVAEHGDGGCAGAIVIRDDQPAFGGDEGESAEIVAGDVFAAGDFGLTLDKDVQLSRGAIGEDDGECI